MCQFLVLSKLSVFKKDILSQLPHTLVKMKCFYIKVLLSTLVPALVAVADFKSTTIAHPFDDFFNSHSKGSLPI